MIFGHASLDVCDESITARLDFILGDKEVLTLLIARSLQCLECALVCDRNYRIYLLGSPQWLGSFIQNVQIATIDEEAMPLTAGGLFEDAEIDHMSKRLCNRGRGDANTLGR